MVRFKNRWLLIEFLPYGDEGGVQQLTSKQIWGALKDSVLLNFGDAGWGSVGSSMNVKYFSPITGSCIIRVAREHYRIVWGAVTLLNSIDNKQFIPTVIHCSGTIKKAQLAAIQYDRATVARLRAQNGISYDDYLSRKAKEVEAMGD